MKILIFLHGTLIMHNSAEFVSREERVHQVKEGEPSVKDYASYIPIGGAVRKIVRWKQQGAEIVYLSSHESGENVEKDKFVLRRFGFAEGPVLFREHGEGYNHVAERIMPDVLIEDDCESIGGESEMTYTNLSPEAKAKIHHITVREFAGVDNLPDSTQELTEFAR